MTQITVSEGQTFTDIAVQYLGDATRANEIAELNSLSLTSDLIVGQVLDIPDVDISKAQLVSSFLDNKIVPASATENSIVNPNTQQGIGFWTIGKDFKVS